MGYAGTPDALMVVMVKDGHDNEGEGGKGIREGREEGSQRANGEWRGGGGSGSSRANWSEGECDLRGRERGREKRQKEDADGRSG